MEENGLVLEYLPTGRANDREREPLAQVVGDRFFTLLEVTPKEGEELRLDEKVYLGKGEREKVKRIKRRITYGDLTSAAKAELEPALRKIVHEREEEFVRFFNKCGPVSMRLHQLELLPGIGKKHLTEILEQREIKEFENFNDIKKRVTLLPDPAGLIVLRVLKEVKGEEQHFLFVKPPAKTREEY